MKVTSELQYDEYRSAMKEQMGSITSFGTERFTGTILGGFFYITYHSGYEFNRRITNQKNRAVGFVSPSADGTEVSAARFSGYTDPVSFVLLYLLFLLGFNLLYGVGFSMLWHLNSLLCAAVVALITAAQVSMTQAGREGARVVEAFLQDPSDYYKYVG